MACYLVVVSASFESGIDPSAASTSVMAELLEFGAAEAHLARDGQRIEMQLPIQARTQADALAKAARLAARSLDGEPVYDVTARVSVAP